MARWAAPYLRGGVLALIAGAAALPILHSGEARAAGTAYAVDTAETTEPGGCKIESWISLASNRDFFGAVNPACGVELFAQFEFSMQVNRARSDGEWSTGIAPKAKMKLVPTAIGSWGWAATVTTSHDVITGENTSVQFALPGTLRLSEIARININPGVLFDRTTGRQYFTYGLGLDLRTSDNVWTLTTEAFGQIGSAGDEGSLTRPRFQVGVRWRPIDRFSVDMIYGRNITGENANWITVGTTIRFPPR
jgi:hypothetical protein